MKLENSEFENDYNQAITPENASSIVSLIYQSSHHTVFKIKINNRWMFLKRIVTKQQNNPIYIENLQREFEIGFTLDHPGIVTYYNHGKDSEGHYLLTEYIEGKMLREYILQNKPTKDFILNFMSQMLDILNYLHSKNIYHLDLKPENILISSKNNQIKLIDFGLSNSDMYSKIPSGTYKYAAPEMFSHPEKCNAASDIYSLGILLLELFTGSIEKKELKLVPRNFQNLIAKCLNENQEDRFQNCKELSQALIQSKQLKIRRIIFLSLSILIFIFCWFILFQPNKIQAEKYISLPNLPEVRNAGRAVKDGANLFYFGGADAAFVRNSTWKFDFKKKKWEEKSNMPIARAEMGCAKINNNVYLFGGWEPEIGELKKSSVYHINTNSWDSLPDLPKGIVSVFAAPLKQNIYILGGTLGETKPYFFRYSVKSSSYTQLPLFKNKRMYASLAVFNNEIYAFGGNSFKKGEYQWHNEVDKFNPKTNQWESLAKIPIPISRSSVIVKGNEIHLLGGSNLYGNNKEGIKKVHFIYLPLKNKWIKKTNLPFPICCHQTALYKGKIVILGGSSEFPNPTKKMVIQK